MHPHVNMLETNRGFQAPLRLYVHVCTHSMLRVSCQTHGGQCFNLESGSGHGDGN